MQRTFLVAIGGKTESECHAYHWSRALVSRVLIGLLPYSRHSQEHRMTMLRLNENSIGASYKPSIKQTSIKLYVSSNIIYFHPIDYQQIQLLINNNVLVKCKSHCNCKHWKFPMPKTKNTTIISLGRSDGSLVTRFQRLNHVAVAGKWLLLPLETKKVVRGNTVILCRKHRHQSSVAPSSKDWSYYLQQKQGR